MNNKTKRGIEILIIGIILFISIIPLIHADDTGVQALPYVHDAKIPKHEKINPVGDFLVNQFTGSSSYIYPIETPKGTNGLTPKINLLYNSHSTQSRPTELGTGWYLTRNYIQRDVNWTFNNISDDIFKLYLNDNSYDLVFNSTGNRFHTKIETFMLIQNKTGTNNTKQQYWELRTKDGTNY